MLIEILKKIYKADKKSDYVKLRRKFNRDLRRTIIKFSNILRNITNKISIMNDLRSRISALKNNHEMLTPKMSKLLKILSLEEKDFRTDNEGMQDWLMGSVYHMPYMGLGEFSTRK